MRLALLVLLTPVVLLFASPPVLAQSVPRCGEQPAVFAVATRADPLSTQPGGPTPMAFIVDYVTIGVCHLDQFLREASQYAKDRAKPQETISLFINGLDAGVMPAKIDIDRQSLTFPLARTAENTDVWKPLLYNPLFERIEVLFVSVGRRGDRPLPKVPEAKMEIIFHKLWVDWTTWVLTVGLIAIVVAAVSCGKYTDMLRDGPAVGNIRQPFSAGRVQMALWFLLIMMGYVLIWLVTGDLASLHPSLLVLMGISVATGLAATVITPPVVSRAQAVAKQLTTERQAFDQALAALQEEIAAVDAKMAATSQPAAAVEAQKAALQQKQVALESTRDQLVLALIGQAPIVASQGFWNDLVTDDRGAVALDRFQIVAWTAVLSFLFLYSVLFYLTMPEFDTTMLALLGISSSAYIGFNMSQTSKASG